VPTITIDFDRIAGALTRCATVFATGLRGAATRGILTLVLVGHEVLLKNCDYLGRIESSTLNQFPSNLGGHASVVLEQRHIGSHGVAAATFSH
jgi:hypothetical protein